MRAKKLLLIPKYISAFAIIKSQIKNALLYYTLTETARRWSYLAYNKEAHTSLTRITHNLPAVFSRQKSPN